jgi:hypothetical protein
MNLLGAAVRHATFGEGTVLDQTGNYLVISFAEGKKQFLFPNAFSKHITAVDPKIAVSIKTEVAKYEASEVAILEQNRLQRIAAQYAQRDAMMKAAAAAKPLKKKAAKPAVKAAEEPKA